MVGDDRAGDGRRAVRRAAAQTRVSGSPSASVAEIVGVIQRLATRLSDMVTATGALRNDRDHFVPKRKIHACCAGRAGRCGVRSARPVGRRGDARQSIGAVTELLLSTALAPDAGAVKVTTAPSTHADIIGRDRQRQRIRKGRVNDRALRCARLVSECETTRFRRADVAGSEITHPALIP